MYTSAVYTQGQLGEHPDCSKPASTPRLRADAPAAGAGPAGGRDRAPHRGPPQHPLRSPLTVATQEPNGVCSQASPCLCSDSLRTSLLSCSHSLRMGSDSGSWPNGIKLGKANGGYYSKLRHLQFNNFAISTLFWA